MKVRSNWIENTSSILTNERNHQIKTDLPEYRLGKNSGPTPSELMIMSLAGSITTIFSMLAIKRGLTVEVLTCELETDNRFGEVVPEKIQGHLNVKTSDFREAETIWKMTQKICTTTQILRQAKIPIIVDLNLQLIDADKKQTADSINIEPIH